MFLFVWERECFYTHKFFKINSLQDDVEFRQLHWNSNLNDKSSGQMTEIFLTEFIPAKKKIEGSALYEDELLDNSYLCKLNASDTILIEK